MNLRLHITTRILRKQKVPKVEMSVVDLDKSLIYPVNYICKFPSRGIEKLYNTEFGRIFGKRSHELARVLLTEALEYAHQPVIKADIETRLNVIEKSQVRVKGKMLSRDFAAFIATLQDCGEVDRATAISVLAEIFVSYSRQVNVENVFLNTVTQRGQYAIMLKASPTDLAKELIKPILEKHGLVMRDRGDFIFIHSA